MKIITVLFSGLIFIWVIVPCYLVGVSAFVIWRCLKYVWMMARDSMDD